jgi:glycerol uptake facilitator-like aquaporin
MARLPMEESSRELDVYSRLILVVYFFNLQGFLLAQLLGGIVGAGLVYANYIHAIDIVEGGRHIRTLNTAGLFATYAVSSPHPRSAGIS